MKFAIGPALAWVGATLVVAGGGTGWWPWWAAILVAILATCLGYLAWWGHEG